ncbi:MAG: B12-binding domain-containing radical SAM protein [Thermodesulfobacteriota bacterium]
MDTKKILLLNPPGTKLYIRDYYCSKVSKADYLYQPADLLILSGIIGERYTPILVDAMVSGFDTERCYRKIVSLSPDAIVFLTGAVSWQEDSIFIERIKETINCPVIGTGDIFLENGEKILRDHNFLDALLLDFTNNDIIHLISGDYDLLENIIYRKADRIIKRSTTRKRGEGFEIPIPKHELFTGRYTYPFVRRLPFATVLTDYGCPYKCSFCIMGKIGFKYRGVENVMYELKHIKGLGYKEVYFNDQTFGAKRDRVLAICNGMIKEGLGLGWVCWSRVDIIDEALLSTMKKAGCHTIMFGVETANDATLKAMRKGYDQRQITETFRLCKEKNVRTLATYLIGLPGEDRDDILGTLRFAIELDSDYASFNVLVPRAGTDIRKSAVEARLIPDDLIEMDQSGTYAVMGNEFLTSEEVWELKEEAFKMFYNRPSYIWKRAKGIRSLYELKTLSKAGIKRFF